MGDPKLRTISLGGGVQSTVMALMAAEGDFGPVPDCAIFADTGWEPRQVYENIPWLRDRLPFAIHCSTVPGARRERTPAPRNWRSFRLIGFTFQSPVHWRWPM